MAHQSPHLTFDELDALVRDGAMGAEREAHARECGACAERVRAAQRVRATLTGSAQPAVAGAGAGAPLTAECREPAEIAVLIGGTDAASTSFLSHAVSCEHCGPLVEAAVSEMPERDEDRALLADLQTGRPEWRRQMAFRLAAAGRQQPVVKRRWIAATAGLLAAAALVVLAVRIARSPVDRPELQELVAAVASVAQRPVDGRLTGGFAYAPPPTLLRGPAGEASPRVRIAAAKLEETVRANDTAATQAAVGVGFLAVGELDKAVDALENAVQQSPGDARYQNDLAAAYLARAKWRDRAEDWPKALATAERAIKADASLIEAHFNRALAIEGLHLTEEAISAWTAYQSLEPSSKWSTEAAEHAAKLRELLSAPKPQSNQEFRERIEDQLLMKWGEAVIAADFATASRLLNEAESAAATLARAGGDTMARDEVVLIRQATTRNPSALTALANGHVLFGRARHEFTSNRFRQASELMTQASAHFDRVPTNYSQWGPIYRAMVLWVAGLAPEALRELAVVRSDELPATYFHLPGRLYWTRAVALTMIGRFDTARDDLRLSVDAFRRGNETENLSATQAGLAEAEWLLGEHSSMWKHEIDALSNLRFLGVSLRRNIVLIEAAIIALNTGLPESALYFQNSLVRSIETAQATAGRPDAYMRRARIYAKLSDTQAALADLDRAETAALQVEDQGLRARYVAEAQQVRGELSPDHATALQATNLALEYFERAGPPTRLAELLGRRAKLFEAQQNWALARRDFKAATEAFDRDRAALRTPLARVQAYEQRRSAFRELIRFEVDTAGDFGEALRMAERARARSLVESFAGPTADSVDPAAAATSIRADTAVVYYAVLDDRVLVWVLTCEETSQFSSPLTRAQLQADVRRLRRLVGEGASVSQLSSATNRLFVQLVQPAIKKAPTKSVLVFVPDGPLSLVPFSALSDLDARPLIETHAVAMAPSLTTFVTASQRLDPLSFEGVLAVGDGHDTAASGLARLPAANDEAAVISRLYEKATLLTGAAATKYRFLQSAQAVIHFSGHAVLDPEFPMLSRLLLAPDPSRNDGGTLLADEIARHRFHGTQLVVLATCDGAAGRLIDGEGEISIARMFLESGVPSTIASLWAVDESAKSLLVAFHHQLRLLRDPVLALQASQRSFLRDRGAAAPVRLWGGFVAMGGMLHTPTERRER